jgi:hypothetical protein
MKRPTWRTKYIGERDGFFIELSFEEETMCPVHHFQKECGWTADFYEKIKNYYWFSVKVTAYRGTVECGHAYMGANCYETLGDVMGSGGDAGVLSGYLPQLIEEAVDDANANLTNQRVGL